MLRPIFFLGMVLSLTGCAGLTPPAPSTGHLSLASTTPFVPKTESTKETRPSGLPAVPSPLPPSSQKKITIAVQQVPVSLLLLTIARDLKINLNLHPKVTGLVSLNLVNVSFADVLERVQEQLDLRYEQRGATWIVFPDQPYLKHYPIDYVNIQRATYAESSMMNQVTGALGMTAAPFSSAAPAPNSSTDNGLSSGLPALGTAPRQQNFSSLQLKNISTNSFWQTLIKNIQLLLDDQEVNNNGQSEPVATSNTKSMSIIPNPEASLLSVYASSKQHQRIEAFLNQVLKNIKKQVLIEATVVEVELNQEYHQGINWSRLAGEQAGWTLTQAPSVNFQGGLDKVLSIGYQNAQSQIGNISGTVTLLERFGKVKVLSSPKINALNNQTALLKVVDNRVYFTADVIQNATGGQSSVLTTYVRSNLHTVPVGLTMHVTPQIDDEETVTLNIRPVITRIIGYVADPNPELAKAGVKSLIPETQSRELESLLRVKSGEITVIGGLMQESLDKSREGPFDLGEGLLGQIFNARRESAKKTELVIFLRPLVLKTASLQNELKPFQVFLPK